MRRPLALALIALAVPAAAHRAPTGWAYDHECCHTQDCAPVPDAAVREVAGGYAVRIEPGTHPMLRSGPALEAFVAHGDPRIRPSGDQHRHACVIGDRVICLYVPPGGV